MSFAKGLSGFVAGAGAGVIAVAAVSLYVPQFQGSNSSVDEAVVTEVPKDSVEPQVEPKEEAIFNTSDPVEEPTITTTPKKEAVKTEGENVTTPNITEPVSEIETDTTAEIIEPKTEETLKPDDELKDEVAKSEAELTKTEMATEEPASEVKSDTEKPKEVAVAPPKEDLPKLALNSEQPKPEEKPKKFKLPTIEPEKPSDDTFVVNDTPPKKEGISVGKKPSSKLPKITIDDPESDNEIATEEANLVKSALELNATKFEGTDKPLMGVILRDIGDKGLAVDKLQKLNAPITIAILSDAPNASERALEYHAAGFEVIAMASDDRNSPLNTAKNSKQIQDAINVVFTNVPNAIGMLDSTQAKIQKNGRTSKVVVENFVETGHGLVTYAKGLNSVDREAKAAGVRTGKVLRKLDDNRENKALMGRYLDRVSLDAGRDGAVIVFGTTAKETVAAIAGWVLSSKGQSVTLAPASAVLLGK